MQDGNCRNRYHDGDGEQNKNFQNSGVATIVY